MLKSIFIHDCSSTHFSSIQIPNPLCHSIHKVSLYLFHNISHLMLFVRLHFHIYGKYRQFFISIFERCVNYRVFIYAKNRNICYSRTKCENRGRIARSAELKEQRGMWVKDPDRERQRDRQRETEKGKGEKRNKTPYVNPLIRIFISENMDEQTKFSNGINFRETYFEQFPSLDMSFMYHYLFLFARPFTFRQHFLFHSPSLASLCHLPHFE